jgi:hypothetical protein
MLNSSYSKSEALTQIEFLIDYAWKQAIKYRFDPIVGKIHSDYLEMVKETKNQIKRQNERAVFDHKSKLLNL